MNENLYFESTSCLIGLSHSHESLCASIVIQWCYSSALTCENMLSYTREALLALNKNENCPKLSKDEVNIINHLGFQRKF